MVRKIVRSKNRPDEEEARRSVPAPRLFRGKRSRNPQSGESGSLPGDARGRVVRLHIFFHPACNSQQGRSKKSLASIMFRFKTVPKILLTPPSPALDYLHEEFSLGELSFRQATLS